MENTNTHLAPRLNDEQQIVFSKDYWLMILGEIRNMRKAIIALTAYVEEREMMLDAFGVRQKFSIGRDLLASYRKAGLPAVMLGRKYFYKASDIIEFRRNAQSTKA